MDGPLTQFCNKLRQLKVFDKNKGSTIPVKNSQSMDPSRYVSVVFSYFCREWHLRKFLILGDLSRHLFGLISPCPTSEKMRVGVHRMPAPPPPLPQ